MTFALSIEIKAIIFYTSKMGNFHNSACHSHIVYILLDTLRKVLDLNLKPCFIFSVDAPFFINSSAHSKFPVSTAISKGENPSEFLTFIVVAFSMRTLAQSVRPLDTASWRGKIPFIAREFKSASPILINLKSSGSSFPLRPVLCSRISGQDGFLLRSRLQSSTRLLRASAVKLLVAFLEGLILFFRLFSCFEALFFFWIFFWGIIPSFLHWWLTILFLDSAQHFRM